MSNPTKEERTMKLFEEAEKAVLAGGNRRAIPTQEAVIEVIRQAEAACLKGHEEALKEVQETAQEMREVNEAIERGTIPTAEVPRQQTSEKPIQVSILMNVDQDKAKGSLMLHDVLNIEGLEFQEAVHLFGEWFTRMRKSLHAIGPHPIPLPGRKSSSSSQL